MTTPTNRKNIYRSARSATGINKRQWARLFSLGETKGAAEVYKKELEDGEPGSRGVSMADALSATLIEYLFSQGYDVENMVFDEYGNIVDIPKTT